MFKLQSDEVTYLYKKTQDKYICQKQLFDGTILNEVVISEKEYNTVYFKMFRVAEGRLCKKEIEYIAKRVIKRAQDVLPKSAEHPVKDEYNRGIIYKFSVILAIDGIKVLSKKTDYDAILKKMAEIMDKDKLEIIYLPYSVGILKKRAIK